MSPLLRENPDVLAALIAAAADQLGLDQYYVEKDFWAMEVLRACAYPVEITGQTGSGPVTVLGGHLTLFPARMCENPHGVPAPTGPGRA